MKILIVTQKVDIDDPILGFFHGWIEEFARQCEQVTVVCLYKGRYDLPKNVKVLSLGKEEGVSRIKYLYRLYKYSWQERRNYDSVFVHMNPEYVPFGYFIWKPLNKNIGIWYTHKSVNLRLRLAEFFTDRIFTATKESFRLKSDKIKILGHGIDLNNFPTNNVNPDISNGLKLVSVGRISKIKNYEAVINTLASAINLDFTFKIIGDAVLPEDKQYLQEIVDLIKQKGLSDKIRLVGPVKHSDLHKYLEGSNIFIHTSLTGSLDKVVLEAILSGLIVVSCNDSSKEVLMPYDDILCFKIDGSDLLQKLNGIMALEGQERDKIIKELKAKVEERHNLSALIKKIIDLYI